MQRSLAPADVPASTMDDLADLARDLWPAVWRDAILDCIDRRAVIGTPIAEHVPNRIVDGRLALVGDAAHVATPMTGSGFSAALYDAEALADAFPSRGPGGSIAEGLLEYETARLDNVQRMVESGRQFSRSFARRAA
ncbi:FAD-dependent monooxygenase [Nocardia sp. CA2R105]|uniref:FAD-dependent oxidoreductase n=1 Tax=Nocardia coffeae TaxID=2873381 RepID=UPI001CA643DC|nr:FAD-dependent monooxygenase [Nocardia coffeae]MBY8858701.1 FAD-dependent monooxygenase [Nocardia coffeae]